MKQEKYGFVYIWYDRKHKRYYIGCHWGSIDDGYICSSPWMMQAYRIRPQDFKRKIIKTNIQSRPLLYEEEQKWLGMIKENEIKPINPKPKYYNLHIKNNNVWHKYDEHIKSVGQKISASKKGKKTGPRDPSVGKAISAAKKGKALTEEHKAALRGIKKKPHTEDWKMQNSLRMKEQWSINNKRREAVSRASKKRWAEYKEEKSRSLTSD